MTAKDTHFPLMPGSRFRDTGDARPTYMYANQGGQQVGGSGLPKELRDRTAVRKANADKLAVDEEKTGVAQGPLPRPRTSRTLPSSRRTSTIGPVSRTPRRLSTAARTRSQEVQGCLETATGPKRDEPGNP